MNNCNARLIRESIVHPRTCAECGMGPCKFPAEQKKLKKDIAVSKGNMVLTGRTSTFGGPGDHGVSASEDLALYETVHNAPERLFLFDQPVGTSGTARRLNPEAYYIAFRFAAVPSNKGMMLHDPRSRQQLGRCVDFCTPRARLLKYQVRVRSADSPKGFLVWVVDWGPNDRTRRMFDISPGLSDALGVQTDEMISVEFPSEMILT